MIKTIVARDAAEITDEPGIVVEATTPAHVIIFDMVADGISIK